MRRSLLLAVLVLTGLVATSALEATAAKPSRPDKDGPAITQLYGWTGYDALPTMQPATNVQVQVSGLTQSRTAFVHLQVAYRDEGGAVLESFDVARVALWNVAPKVFVSTEFVTHVPEGAATLEASAQLILNGRPRGAIQADSGRLPSPWQPNVNVFAD